MTSEAGQGTHPLVAFYDGSGTDHAGRTLKDVLSFGYDDLEERHDFVQWLFPLTKPSRFQPQVPTLSAEAIDAFKSSATLRERVLFSLDVMLDFYGFERKAGGVRRSANFPLHVDAWAWPDDHNFMRLSRIMQSLNLLGLRDEALALQEALLAAAGDLGPERIPSATVQHWQKLLRD